MKTIINKIRWNKISRDSIPPENTPILLFNKKEYIEYSYIFNENFFERYPDTGWTHWAEINLPQNDEIQHEN